MRVSRISGKLEKSARQLQQTVEKLRLATGFEHDAWAEVLKLSTKSYARIRQGREHLPASCLAHLGNKLNLSVDALMNGRLDYKAITQHYQGNVLYVPEKYMVAAFSRRRSALNILAYVEANLGWLAADYATRYFQVSSAALMKADSNINILFMSDLLQYLRKNGLSPQQVVSMGLQNVALTKRSPFGQELAKARSLIEVYERMLVELLPFLEQNCSYRIKKLSNASCTIVSRSNQDVAAALRRKQVGDANTCLYRLGTFAASPSYIGLPHASVKELTCVHRGDKACTFQVDYGHATRTHLN